MYNLDKEVEIIPTESGVLIRNPNYTVEVKEKTN